MTPDAHTLKHITSWLQQLGQACSHPPDAPPTKEKWAVLATMLGQDYPSGAFTAASLRATAEGNEWFPAYDVVRSRVGSWWMANRPAVARGIEDPRYVGLTATERRWMAFWDAAVARSFGPPHEGAAAIGPGVIGSLVRHFAPRVSDRLSPSDVPADPDALREHLDREWDNDEKVYEMAWQYRDDPAALALLRLVLKAHAPQHLHLVPDAPADAGSRDQDGPKPIRALTLTGARLEAARARRVA